jgi:Peptidase family M23/LysM domain
VLKAYFCHRMKKTLAKYLLICGFLSPVSSYTQVESAIELMNDTASWENYEPHIGGAEEEELNSETPLFIEKTIDLGLWTVADSMARIPAYDEYCHWDTRNVWYHKEDLSNMTEALPFVLCREECDFAFPTITGHQTSPFGPRWGRMHSGLDLDLETGDPVMAAFEGMVRISQYHPSYGNVVVVRHNNGLETVYAHLSARDVVPGEHVEAGQVVGLGGNTGRSYGSHLHFEVRYKGQAIDPNYVIDPQNMKLRDWTFVLTKEHLTPSTPLPNAAQSEASSSRSAKYHIVRSGETLSTIAHKRGTTVSKLCKLNKMRQSSVIRPGQKLRYR